MLLLAALGADPGAWDEAQVGGAARGLSPVATLGERELVDHLVVGPRPGIPGGGSSVNTHRGALALAFRLD
jgi:hypothetical protein